MNNDANNILQKLILQQNIFHNEIINLKEQLSSKNNNQDVNKLKLENELLLNKINELNNNKFKLEEDRIKLEKIRDETFSEAIKMQELHNSQQKLEINIKKLIESNKNSLIKYETNIIAYHNINNKSLGNQNYMVYFDDEQLNDISCIEIVNYDFPKKINNITDNNNNFSIKIEDDLHYVSIISNLYDIEGICASLNKTLSNFNIKIKYNKGTNKVQFSSNQNFDLIYSELLGILGFCYNDDLINKNEYESSDICNISINKMINVFIKNINGEKPILKTMLGSKMTPNKISFKDIIKSLNYIELIFKNENNCVLNLDAFMIEFNIKSISKSQRIEINNNISDNVDLLNNLLNNF